MVLSGWGARGIGVGVDDPVECAGLVAVSVEAADEVAAVLVAQGDGPSGDPQHPPESNSNSIGANDSNWLADADFLESASLCEPESRAVPRVGRLGVVWDRRLRSSAVRSSHPQETPHIRYGILAGMVKTTIYLPEELHQGIKQAAKKRGTSEAELIRIAVRHELLGAPADQRERAQRRARLLAAMGRLDSAVYPADYLDGLRAEWRD
jgi:Ribbon-helix-helix protein, copG family